MLYHYPTMPKVAKLINSADSLKPRYFQKWVTVAELKKLTGWSSPTIYRYLYDEKLEAKKELGGQKWLINYLSIPAYIRSRFKEENGEK